MSLKSLLLGSVAGAALAVPAFAADMSYPVKAPPPIVAVPVFTWTGFYLGANVGYGWGDGSAPWDRYFNYYYGGWDGYSYTGGVDPEGWFGGFQLGYNYQFINNVVLGVEADFDFGSLDDKLNYYAYATAPGVLAESYGSVRTKIEAFGTIRARLGYAMDRFLPYVTGGLAWGNVKASGDVSNYINGVYQPGLSGSASSSDTLWGWTVGAGLEYAFTDNWTAKIEYLYADLGDITWDGSSSTDIDAKLQTIKVGVNYKF
ncbi:outer membrane protein [Ancylobacter mangrovi]|uniref:Porin family protein n=1 Tax=Ancylobacter mangrovi TaxID=2972472 RepID=A0A9X2PDR0_9HYPH|nr:outer membrane protein [Ancylobacter mangrovi]MCS0493682.1 porin family protein [Ancylobacter mangrovi]MCS0501700.1 porin family protein [Ancylobacter mangrovi]